MILTPTQKTTLKTHVNTNTNTVDTPAGTIQIKDVLRAEDTYQEVTAWYNANAVPDYFIFKKVVDLYSVMANGYDWTVVDNESVGQARIWDRMLALSARTGGVAPWKITILRGVGEAYKGNTPTTVAPHRRNILRTHFARLCRRWERLFVADTLVVVGEWSVGTNGDRTGARGLVTNPDVMEFDEAGQYLDGNIPVGVLVNAVK